MLDLRIDSVGSAFMVLSRLVVIGLVAVMIVYLGHELLYPIPQAERISE